LRRNWRRLHISNNAPTVATLGNPEPRERDPKKDNRDVRNVTPGTCEEEMVLQKVSESPHPKRDANSWMSKRKDCVQQTLQDGLIMEKFTKSIITRAPGKYLQISYGLYLDFVIWRNLRKIGLPYPLFRWILFWLKCFGGL